MRTRLILILLFITAFSAAAQYPVRTIHNYPATKPAELHFVDGNVGNYPVTRISKELIRVESGDRTLRMPLTYLESVKFSDGCTLFFENGQFQFDKLVQPALLKNESGDALLQGVLKLSKEQAEALMGPETYSQFRKNSVVLKAGIGTLAAGTMLCIPYFSSIVLNSFGDERGTSIFNSMGPAWQGITIGGGCLLIGGIVAALIGNSGCNHAISAYNDGLGVVYHF